ncbi:MAG: tRNA 4-thiouridine(8) synthase ThiI [Oscillospiraceae bacterium]|jgi:thiamine biosynthesis protein ThiI|nr:tRNA 4-thiouridine(8) synthase ThiI [Oscillospiraceae bacterium]
MRSLLLVRFGEVHLKGLNRPYFMHALLRHIRRAVADVGGEVWLSDSRIFVSGADDMEECARRVCRVFGVHSVSPALEMEKDDFAAICEQAVGLLRPLGGTFKVAARRSDKRYPLDSPAINGKIGAYVLAKLPHLAVDVHAPDHRLDVEIRDKAYLYVTRMPAVGGLPMGTNGKACLLLSGGIDSPVAGFMVAKRGVALTCVHFHSFPYTSERAKQKVVDLAKVLSGYCGPVRLHVVPFTHIQMDIHRLCPDNLGTLVMRRFMMRIAQRVALTEGAQALVTGESIGQVASQTMEALACTNETVTLPVFRPLIGFDKSEIVERAETIGTYALSSLPYEDCCTVFTPRHPVTHPKPEKVAQAEAALDVEALVEEAVAGIELVETGATGAE